MSSPAASGQSRGSLSSLYARRLAECRTWRGKSTIETRDANIRDRPGEKGWFACYGRMIECDVRCCSKGLLSRLGAQRETVAGASPTPECETRGYAAVQFCSSQNRSQKYSAQGLQATLAPQGSRQRTGANMEAPMPNSCQLSASHLTPENSHSQHKKTCLKHYTTIYLAFASTEALASRMLFFCSLVPPDR